MAVHKDINQTAILTRNLIVILADSTVSNVISIFPL